MVIHQGCASCDGLPFRGAKLSDIYCAGDFLNGDGPSDDDLGNYVSNSYALVPPETIDGSSEDVCVCLWCPPDPPSGFDVGNVYDYDVDDDFFYDFCRSLSTRI